VKRALVLALRQSLIRVLRRCAGAVEVARYHRVDLWIVLFDARNVVIGQFRRADLASAQHPAKIGCGAEMKLLHGIPLLVLIALTALDGVGHGQGK